MKTKSKLLFAIGLLAALCIGFLVGISVDYPAPLKSDLAGTFGKAEKFHKVQMTAKDIQLRSELLKDTAQLRGMIQGIIYFSLFTEDVCKEIDLTLNSFKAKGLGSQAGENEAVIALQDYSDFIRNNNKTLSSTITLLTGFYMKDTADFTLDIEKNLKDFGSFVNALNQKNMVLVQALKSIDGFMASNKALQANTKEVAQLKSIRDQLLIKGLQLGGIMSSEKLVGQMVIQALGSTQVNAALVENRSVSASIKQQGQVNALGREVLYYNLQSQLFSYGNKDMNQNTVKGQELNLGYLGKDNIVLNLPNYAMGDVYQSHGVGNLPIMSLNHLFIGSTFQNTFSSYINFEGFVNSMGSSLEGAPRILLSNEK